MSDWKVNDGPLPGALKAGKQRPDGIHSPPQTASWRNGRRDGLKIRFPQGSEGSSPSGASEHVTRF